MTSKKIELLVPAGSLANLKAAVVNGADAVYLGGNRFNAREFATNFNKDYLIDAIKICKSNDVKVFFTMNTLIKNPEIKDFFDELSYAYSLGIDAVIIQEISFLPLIKKFFPDFKVHISTQAGVMNSSHANLLKDSDRINLARELNKENIRSLRKNFNKELEIFVHGALCVCVSGSCLFSSFVGGRSGNRGKCSQSCRRKYNNTFYLSTKELCLASEIPEIIKMNINSIKIEGRMRTPYYVATVTDIYRKAIDSYYSGNFKLTKEDMTRLESAFSRDFTKGKFSSENVFNRNFSSGSSSVIEKRYEPSVKDIDTTRIVPEYSLPDIIEQQSEKRLLVKVYNGHDAISAYENGADIVYYDLFAKDFSLVKKKIKSKLYAYTQRIMFDSDVPIILDMIEKNKPDGLLIGNLGLLNQKLNLPIHLDYNCNCFNDYDVDYFNSLGGFPIVSPELSSTELQNFKNKNFACLVHGKISLMTLAYTLPESVIRDEKGYKFIIKKIRNGVELLNEKELGLFNKARHLTRFGINNIFIDSDKNVAEIVSIYRQILDGKTIDVTKIKNNYVLGWINEGVK